MNRLFIFCIGGTGSRVLKNLIMLLASGAEINAKEIVPIIIDPDSGNGDLNRTIKILKEYRSLNQHSSANGFFSTKITLMNELDGDLDENSVKLEIENTNNMSFQNFIGFQQVSDANKDFLSMLFSQENLDADMNVGFKGNPNIGSVVLNQLNLSPVYKAFVTHFTENDNVFIISSIFGGTGAAGFPLLLKNIRTNQNNNHLSTTKIGSLTVLPYFKVSEDENSAISSNGWISKSKAALNYYFSAIKPDSIFYIGEKHGATEKNSDGAASQKNKSHFVELAGSMSIFKFCQSPGEQQCYEYGINDDTEPIIFKHLHGPSSSLIRDRLTKLILFKTYYNDLITDIKNNNLPYVSKLDLNELNNSSLESFFNHFQEWLSELKENKPAFEPFILNSVDDKFTLNIINGEQKNNSIFSFFKSDKTILQNKLNKEFKSISNKTGLDLLFSLFDINVIK